MMSNEKDSVWHPRIYPIRHRAHGTLVTWLPARGSAPVTSNLMMTFLWLLTLKITQI